MKGVAGTGNGGNEADTYKKGGSEGIAGGKGDQGRPGESDSKLYGRWKRKFWCATKGLKEEIFEVPSFQDEFNEMQGCC
jgi:hypothetical protein